jgi:hypothetical protein
MRCAGKVLNEHLPFCALPELFVIDFLLMEFNSWTHVTGRAQKGKCSFNTLPAHRIAGGRLGWMLAEREEGPRYSSAGQRFGLGAATRQMYSKRNFSL